MQVRRRDDHTWLLSVMMRKRQRSSDARLLVKYPKKSLRYKTRDWENSNYEIWMTKSTNCCERKATGKIEWVASTANCKIFGLAIFFSKSYVGYMHDFLIDRLLRSPTSLYLMCSLLPNVSEDFIGILSTKIHQLAALNEENYLSSDQLLCLCPHALSIWSKFWAHLMSILFVPGLEVLSIFCERLYIVIRLGTGRMGKIAMFKGIIASA